MERVRVASIRIRDILGIEDLTIAPGSLTVIYGRNAAGKSSVLMALKDLADGGHDPTLIRRGADQGSIVMMLEDGVEISKLIRPAKSVMTVVHPNLGKISKPATWIKEVLDGFSVDPVQFLMSVPKLQVDILLGALPVTLDWDALKLVVPEEYLRCGDPNQHALKTLDEIKARVFSKRRELNTSAREKRATASQMQSSLPPEPKDEALRGGVCSGEHTWKEELERLIAHRSTIEKQFADEVGRFKDGANTEVGRLEKEGKAKIDVLQDKLQDEVAGILHDLHEACEQIRVLETEAIEKVRERGRGPVAEVSEQIGTATERVEAEAAAAQTRATIAQFQATAGTVERNAAVLTKALDGIQEMKNGLLRNLPIPDLELVDGEIQVGGLPFNRLNDAERHRIAIEVAKLKAKKLGLILMDRTEIFDDVSWEIFVNTAMTSGLQIIAAKVSDDEELHVSTAQAMSLDETKAG